ncbi:MAG: GDSL-type esterase/lipase family protein, partial [Candidatus Binatia bacterium]|nr:GDSL-type esterase/lipase family protein [Candidatus Binatia bacterium]
MVRSGDTATAGLTRLERDVLERDPRLVVVLLGGNDFLRRVPTAMTEKSLNEMVRRIQDRGAMVVLVGLKLGLFTNEYSPIYERVAEQNRALLIPNV